MRTIGKFEIKALSLNNFVFVFSKMLNNVWLLIHNRL